jgi:hypothetical protein
MTRKKTLCSRLPGAFLPALAVLALVPSPARADWTRLSLTQLTSQYDSFAGDQLPDGRLVYGTKNTVYEQTTFGLAGVTQLGSAPTIDPSDIAIYDAHLGAVGAGGFSASSPIYSFDPGATPASSATFTPVSGVSLQNFSLIFKDSTSLLVGGANGTGSTNGGFFPKEHAITYVPLQPPSMGARSLILVDNIAPYSGGFNLDLAGNLYVVDPSDFTGKNIYEFSAADVAAVIAGGPALTLAQGTRIAHTDQTASLVIDALGRIWTAGSSAIEVYDPAAQTTADYTPQGASYNYRLSTFTTTAGDSYVAYLYADPNAATPTVIYGYDLVQNVPEPAGGCLLAAGAVVFANRRRRHAGATHA